MRILVALLFVFCAVSADQSTVSEDTVEQLVKSCDDGLGECVPFYLCQNGTINIHGEGVLDIRFNSENQCEDYFETCCPVDAVSPEKLVVPKKVVTPETCGIRNSAGILVRITGNENDEAEYGEFPWMVAILEEKNENGATSSLYACGGSLISENVVLTAAHCVEDKNPTTLIVRAGEWDTQTMSEFYPHEDYYVDAIIVHDGYVKKILHNDIALLFLKGSVEFTDNISPICLPPQGHNFDGKTCVTTGWGKNVFGKEGMYQVILKKVDLPTVQYAQCQKFLRKTRLGPRFKLHPSFMCAGGIEGKDSCRGDGGSPLICPIEGSSDQYYQAGIVAWGIGCGDKDVPGVYVNVANFRTWIDSEIASYRSSN